MKLQVLRLKKWQIKLSPSAVPWLLLKNDERTYGPDASGRRQKILQPKVVGTQPTRKFTNEFRLKEK